MEIEDYWERYRTHTEIQKNGAVTNLGDGIAITTHGINTRLIAWPGNGFQTEAVHVLTLKPGEESETYAYDMAEEAMVCFKGKGQILLRGQWLDVEPGDIAYFPFTAERALRNPSENEDDFVVVTSITPPQFDLYEDSGFYDPVNKVMNFEAINYAKLNTKRVQYAPDNEMAFHDSHPEVRAWNLSNDEIRSGGALFNAFYGGPLTGLVQGGADSTDTSSMLLILFAGFGTGAPGFNFCCMAPGMTADIHTHPVSDECVVNWWGGNPCFLGDRWIQTASYDCLLAPRGVRHGGIVPKDAQSVFVGGLAAPPQLDLLINSGYYKDGKFTRPEFAQLAVD